MNGVKHLFSTFDVTRQVFFTSRLSLGIVNLKPLLPGHVLIIPRRVVARLSDLSPEEVIDLFLSVQNVGNVLEKAYKAKALTISLQDGKVAGQSVPHVHVHLIPRHETDYEGDNDQIYPALEAHEHDLGPTLEASSSSSSSVPKSSVGTTEGGSGWRVPKDDERKPRSMDAMESEAKWLESLFT